MAETGYECGGCGHEAQGYTKDELSKRGWVWHTLTKNAYGIAETSFILCEDCARSSELRRTERAQREAPRARCSHCGQSTMVLPALNVVVGTEFTRALPTSLCRTCDRYPAMLRLRTEYEADLLYPLEGDPA